MFWCEETNQKMATKEGSRIFVGGLSPEVTERDLQRTFGRFGEILDCQVLFSNLIILKLRDVLSINF